MAAIVFSGSVSFDGQPLSLAKTYAAEVLVRQRFELAAEAVRVFTFDTGQDGTEIRFLLIKAVKNADLTSAEVSYGTTDAEASDPGSGTNWIVVSGIHGPSWEHKALSTANKFFIYNHTADRLLIDVAIGMEGT